MFVTKTVNCGAVGSEANKGRIYETWNSTAGFRLNAFPDDEPLSEHERAATEEASRRERRGEPLIPHADVLREFGLELEEEVQYVGF